MSRFTLSDLEAIVADRATADPAVSWTARLVEGGMPRASRKMGEEAIETIVAALSGRREEIVSESADLLYHWLVVLAVAGVPLVDVMAELERRTASSGVEEKASRGDRG